MPAPRGDEESKPSLRTLFAVGDFDGAYVYPRFVETSVYHLVVEGREETREVGEELQFRPRLDDRVASTTRCNLLR